MRIIYEDIEDTPNKVLQKVIKALTPCRCKTPEPITQNFHLQCGRCGCIVFTVVLYD